MNKAILAVQTDLAKEILPEGTDFETAVTTAGAGNHIMKGLIRFFEKAAEEDGTEVTVYIPDNVELIGYFEEPTRDQVHFTLESDQFPAPAEGVTDIPRVFFSNCPDDEGKNALVLTIATVV